MADQKLGTFIYLRSLAPLTATEFISDFRQRWPSTSVASEGEEENCLYFSIGDSHIAVGFRPRRVPEPDTDSILRAAAARYYWPTARKELARHRAHLAVAASVDGGDKLLLACNLTRAVVSLLAVSKAIGVCWLNGPVLHPTKSFIAIAAEFLNLKELPLFLWIGVHWKPEGHLVYTKGMSQFGAPELFLAKQPEPSMEVVNYLFDLAQYVLTSGKSLLDGETIDGPNGVLRIETIGRAESGKKGLFLVPVRPN